MASEALRLFDVARGVVRSPRRSYMRCGSAPGCKGWGSARGLARLTQEHDAYRWIGGGVQVNYHTLSDFRVEHGETLDDLLTDSVASLMAVGAVSLKWVAQDGMRVRASAGVASFRRKETLERCLDEARTQVAALKGQIEDDRGALTRREQAGFDQLGGELAPWPPYIKDTLNKY